MRRLLIAAAAACAFAPLLAYAAAGPANYPGIYGAGLHGRPNALMGCKGTSPDECALGVTPHDSSGNPNDATHPVYTAPASNLADVCQNPNIAKSSAIINIGAAATTKIVDVSGTKAIYVCGWSATLAGTTPSVTFKYGTHTSADCDTGAVALSGTYLPTSGSYMHDGDNGVLMSTPAAQQLCATTVGTGSSFQGILRYVQQ